MAAPAKDEAMDETERAFLVGRIMIVLGLFTLGVALVGELLGWWNDFGELLGVLGLVGAGIGLAITVLLSATRGQVTNVGNQVERVGSKVEEVGAKVEQVGVKVDGTNARLDPHTAILEDIRDLLRRGQSPS